MKAFSKNEWITLGIGIVVIFILIAVSGGFSSFSGNNASTTPMTLSSQQPSQASGGKNISTDNRIQIITTQEGTGQEAKPGNTVSVNYVGMFRDGTKFDASADHGGKPIQFVLGQGQVIPGWDIGIKGMKVGGKRHLVISPDLGYGNRQVGPIPANSVLIFDVELVGVK